MKLVLEEHYNLETYIVRLIRIKNSKRVNTQIISVGNEKTLQILQASNDYERKL